jgi:hypothetical protein
VYLEILGGKLDLEGDEEGGKAHDEYNNNNDNIPTWMASDVEFWRWSNHKPPKRGGSVHMKRTKTEDNNDKHIQAMNIIVIIATPIHTLTTSTSPTALFPSILSNSSLTLR